MKKLPKKRIGEILIEEGVLERKTLEKALEVQRKEGGLIGGILVKMGAISENDLVAALSKQLLIPFIQLANYHVNRNALKCVPKELAERHLLFPFDQDIHELWLAVSDPLNQEFLEAVEKNVSQPVQIFLATVSEIRQAITSYYEENS